MDDKSRPQRHGLHTRLRRAASLLAGEPFFHIIAAMQRLRTRAPRSVVSRARWLMAAAMMAAMLGCASSPERLPSPTRQFYYNLPTPADKQAFLKLRESERQAFLEKKGLWAKWTALPAAERQAAQNGELRPGFHEFAAFMAWGPPADTVDRGELRYHTFIRCTSGPKAGRYVPNSLECDGTSSEIEVTVKESVVTEIKYLN